MTMSRWEIKTQTDGMTDDMRVNILGAISTSIDTHGSSDRRAVAKDIKSWIENTYRRNWTVIIGTDYNCSYDGSKTLTVMEKIWDGKLSFISITNSGILYL